MGNYKDFYRFRVFVCVTFLSFPLKSSIKSRDFTVTIYHLFIQKKYATFPVNIRNKSDDKKVTDYWNVDNPACFLNMTLNNKMSEKRSLKYQSMDPEYGTGQVNSRILEFLLRRFCYLIFAPSHKILICFSLIKRFPNDYKRYSSHLQKSMLHQVAPINVFLP